jgi:hypothetical protein
MCLESIVTDTSPCSTRVVLPERKPVELVIERPGIYVPRSLDKKNHLRDRAKQEACSFYNLFRGIR